MLPREAFTPDKNGGLVLEFITACKAYPKGRFGKLPSRGSTHFTLVTPLKNIEAAGIVSDKRFTSLSLTFGDESITIIRRVRPQRKPAGRPPLPASPGQWRVGLGEEQVLEEWLSTDDTLEGIVNAQLFLRELRLLIDALEKGVKTKTLGI